MQESQEVSSVTSTDQEYEKIMASAEHQSFADMKARAEVVEGVVCFPRLILFTSDDQGKKIRLLVKDFTVDPEGLAMEITPAALSPKDPDYHQPEDCKPECDHPILNIVASAWDVLDGSSL